MYTVHIASKLVTTPCGQTVLQPAEIAAIVLLMDESTTAFISVLQEPIREPSPTFLNAASLIISPTVHAFVETPHISREDGDSASPPDHSRVMELSADELPTPMCNKQQQKDAKQARNKQSHYSINDLFLDRPPSKPLKSHDHLFKDGFKSSQTPISPFLTTSLSSPASCQNITVLACIAFVGLYPPVDSSQGQDYSCSVCTHHSAIAKEIKHCIASAVTLMLLPGSFRASRACLGPLSLAAPRNDPILPAGYMQSTVASLSLVFYSDSYTLNPHHHQKEKGAKGYQPHSIPS
ncbi:hypothetical protein ACRALDRAFT_2017962 [Sodiomyces alcalophilus JCM 7366]|uniref:uncharacterized protein n=1 Tax=Sodiomyces alcalophilus JCM 7366 TaxID=591952 RepID=UPI0039B5E138